ncbi:MAG: hypothetical protein LBD12_04345, partial [Clostridiales Family XIII bacterium]|nr:hypothetical protein [Clostridiales Family XIII bacterium]
MTRLLDGKAAAAALLEGLGVRVQALGARGISPTLALVRVGARPDAIAYENAVRRQAESLGIAVRLETLPDGAGADAGAGTGADTDAGTEARAQALQG